MCGGRGLHLFVEADDFECTPLTYDDTPPVRDGRGGVYVDRGGA